MNPDVRGGDPDGRVVLAIYLAALFVPPVGSLLACAAARRRAPEVVDAHGPRALMHQAIALCGVACVQTWVLVITRAAAGALAGPDGPAIRAALWTADALTSAAILAAAALVGPAGWLLGRAAVPARRQAAASLPVPRPPRGVAVPARRQAAASLLVPRLPRGAFAPPAAPAAARGDAAAPPDRLDGPLRFRARTTAPPRDVEFGVSAPTRTLSLDPSARPPVSG